MTNKNIPPTNKGKRFPPEPLTADEIHAMVDNCPSTTAGIRLKAMIGVFYGSGLRVSECLDLMPRDVDTKQGSVYVREGKGKKTRTVGIDPFSLSLITPWLKRREELGFGRNNYLFCGFRKGPKFGQRLQRRYIADALLKLGDKAGIDKRVHPHGLRHSFAFALANDGVPIHIIQRQMGHSKLTTTERYISHLNPKAVIDAMRERQW